MLNYLFNNHVVTINQPHAPSLAAARLEYQNDVLGCDKPIDHIRKRNDGTGEIFQDKQHILYLFNFMESHNFLENPHSHQLWSWSSQKKEKNTLSQMRLGSVFKMRVSILNTATTEQMG
nr:hypothetical protein [uncultured Anaerobutyricum sp.]